MVQNYQGDLIVINKTNDLYQGENSSEIGLYKI